SGETVAVPVSKVERVIEVPAEAIERSGCEAFTLVDDCPVAVVDLASQLALPAATRKDQVTLVLGEVRGELMALEIDHIAGHQQIYVKPVPELLASVRVLAGLTILGDGTPVFVLDLNQLS
ncbi:MAG: chemotaxis protein CheW, partial [Myxococcota bacterium]